MYCSVILVALVLIVEPKIVAGPAFVAAMALWSHRYFQNRLNLKDASFATGFVVRKEDSEGKKRFIDCLAAFFALCTVGLLGLEAWRTATALLA